MNNIDPKKWGPSGWDFLHYITLSYPDNPSDQNKTNMINFMSSVGNVLPCEICRNNFHKHMTKYPLNNEALRSRYNLIIWLINIHNEVNKHTGHRLLDYDNIINKYIYENDDQNIGKIIKTIIKTIMVILLIIILIGLLKKRNK